MSDKPPYADEVASAVARCKVLCEDAVGMLPSLVERGASVLSDLDVAAQALERALHTVGAPREADTRKPDYDAVELHVAPASMLPEEDEPERELIGADDASASNDGPAEALRLAGDLHTVGKIVERERLVIDPKDYRFSSMASELIAKLAEDERVGEKGARILVDCVRFMDAIDRDYPAPENEVLARAMDGFRSDIAEHLDREHGLRFTPDPRAEGEDRQHALSAIQGAKRRLFPSKEPAGSALSLGKRGIEHGSVREAPEVVTSTGTASPAFSLANSVALGLLKPIDQPAQARKAKAVAFKEIRQRLLPQLAEADAGRETTVLRYVVNAVQPLNSDGSVTELLGRILDDLKRRGLKTIPATTGVQFDESFKPSRFERRVVRSDRPRGEVVEVMQIGFTNADGIPVQKTVLGVSDGSGAA